MPTPQVGPDLGEDPAVGFLEGGYGPSASGSDRPYLNALQKYTHVVEDGLTEVVGGGIECALDGGSFEIALYDVTDGVAGEAPMVFKQTVTLPERQRSDEDGYEVATYTFELDPVPLADYVGRELAVAVRHDTGREWGQNWSDEFDPENGSSIATGSRGGQLSDPWEPSLRDRGSASTGALFVEAIAIPEGKARTVVGSERHDPQSETVFAAFPDVTVESGQQIEYDAETAAGASVTVLPNGVVRVGQGSAATDSFEVSLSDGEGTWHGPETITLTEDTGLSVEDYTDPETGQVDRSGALEAVTDWQDERIDDDLLLTVLDRWHAEGTDG